MSIIYISSLRAESPDSARDWKIIQQAKANDIEAELRTEAEIAELRGRSESDIAPGTPVLVEFRLS